MNAENLICQYDKCKLILQDPINLPCGRTFCSKHLYENVLAVNEFKCYFCDRHHKIDIDEFETNEIINKLIESLIDSNPTRKQIRKLFSNLEELIKENELFNPNGYVSDYFKIIRQKVIQHRDNLINKIKTQSGKIIDFLREKEKKCKLNIVKLTNNNKIDLDEFKYNELPLWKKQIRMANFDQTNLDKLLIEINEKINDIQLQIQTFKNDLLLNESIEFEKYQQNDDMMIFGVLDIKLNHLRLSQNSQLIRTIDTRHSNWITSIEVNERLNKLISASSPFDQTLKIWNLSTGECLKILNEKGSHQNSNQFTRSTKRILSIPKTNKLINISGDRTIQIIDLISYELVDTIVNDSNINSLCLINENVLACGCDDGYIFIWDLKTSTKKVSFKAHDDWIKDLKLINQTKLVSCSNEKIIKIWSLEPSIECIKEIADHSNSNIELNLNAGYILSYSLNKIIKLWHLETGELLESINFDDPICSVIKLNDDLIGVGLQNGDIVIYNTKRLKSIKRISAHTEINHFRQGSVIQMYLMSNGCLLSGSKNGEIKLWKIFE